jgi:hypothetical protein
MNRRQMLNSTLLTPIAVVTATGSVAIADAATEADASSKSQGGASFRIETDSLGEVKVPADKLWGAQNSAHSNILASDPI